MSGMALQPHQRSIEHQLGRKYAQKKDQVLVKPDLFDSLGESTSKSYFPRREGYMWGCMRRMHPHIYPRSSLASGFCS